MVTLDQFDEEFVPPRASITNQESAGIPSDFIDNTNNNDSDEDIDDPPPDKNPDNRNSDDNQEEVKQDSDDDEEEGNPSTPHPSTQFVDPPVYQYFEAVSTEEVGTKHKHMKALFSMDLDSIAIVSNNVSNILKRMRSPKTEEKTLEPPTTTISFSTHFQRTYTPNSSRFYVKSNTGPGGVRLLNKKTGSTSHQTVNLARFRSIRLAKILSSNMEYQLELYLVSGRSFHGRTNYFTKELLFPLVAAYNSVFNHPEKFLTSTCSPEKAQRLKTVFNQKGEIFMITPEGKVPALKRKKPVYITLSQEDATLFFRAVEFALLNICSPPRQWLCTYLAKTYLPEKLSVSYGREALRKDAQTVVASQLYCAQVAGIQNICPVKPSMVLELSEVDKIRKFCEAASESILEKIKKDVEEPTQSASDTPEDHATKFLFDIALTVKPMEPNVSFLTSYDSGHRIANELMNQKPPTRRSATSQNASIRQAKSRSEFLESQDDGEVMKEHCRNWFVDDRARLRELGRTTAPDLGLLAGPGGGNRIEPRPDFAESLQAIRATQRSNRNRFSRFSNETVRVVVPPQGNDQTEVSSVGDMEEIQTETTVAEGCKYKGYQNPSDFYPAGEHPGNWSHSTNDNEPGRSTLKFYRPDQFSLPLLVGNPNTEYTRKCNSVVKSIHEALTTGPSALEDEKTIETESKKALDYMHQTRINNVRRGSYQRMYASEGVTGLDIEVADDGGGGEHDEIVALPEEEEEDDLNSESSTVTNRERDAGSSSENESSNNVDEPDVPTEIAIENQRRLIQKFPQMGSNVIGNCHVSNSTLKGTQQTISTDGGHGSRFVLQKEGMINGVNMYTGFTRSFWLKRSMPQFFHSLSNMVSLGETILAGDASTQPELVLISNSTKHLSPDTIVKKKTEAMTAVVKQCSETMDYIRERMQGADSHSVRLELTFNFNKIDQSTKLFWPFPRLHKDITQWFRVADTCDLTDFFTMFEDRNVSILEKVFCNPENLIRAHLLSPPAKTAIMFLIECLVKVLDGNGFFGPITEAFYTDLSLTVPDEAIVRITQYDKDITGLEYGIHPMFLRCSRTSEFKISRPVGFAVSSAKWLATPHSQHVNWPNRFFYQANRIDALIKTTFSALQELKNSGEEGGPPTDDQIIKYILSNRDFCPKFISIDFSQIVKVSLRVQKVIMFLIAGDLNSLYNDIWTLRIRNVLKKNDSRTSYSSLRIPETEGEMDELSEELREHIKVANCEDGHPRHMVNGLSRASEVEKMAFCHGQQFVEDQLWKKCPSRTLFIYAVTYLNHLHNAARNLPKPPPAPENEDPPESPETNLFCKDPAQLLIEYFINVRAYSNPSHEGSKPIIWCTTPNRLTKFAGIACYTEVSIPALDPQNRHHHSRYVSRRTLQASSPAQAAPHPPPPPRERVVTTAPQQRTAVRSPTRQGPIRRGDRNETPSTDTTYDSELHQSIKATGEELGRLLGKETTKKLVKNEFFSQCTDRFKESGERGGSPVPIHEVICVRAMVLAILSYQNHEPLDFSKAAVKQAKWIDAAGNTTLGNEFRLSYLFTSRQALEDKGRKIKGTYKITSISSPSELIGGASGIQDKEVTLAIWIAAVRPLEAIDLHEFFIANSDRRPTVDTATLFTAPVQNGREASQWEDILEEILEGNLMPSHLSKVAFARTLYMERQLVALKHVELDHRNMDDANKYKELWKSPDQQVEDITHLQLIPPYKKPKIHVPTYST